MHLDEKKETHVKKKPEVGDEGEIEKAFDRGEGGAITFQKIPTAVHGRVVASFDYHMRCYQQGRDLATKERANATNIKGDDCTWCFENKGVKWTNHTEATCRNKKRTEKKGGGGRSRDYDVKRPEKEGGGCGDVKNSREVCHVCGF